MNRDYSDVCFPEILRKTLTRMNKAFKRAYPTIKREFASFKQEEISYYNKLHHDLPGIEILVDALEDSAIIGSHSYNAPRFLKDEDSPFWLQYSELMHVPKRDEKEFFDFANARSFPYLLCTIAQNKVLAALLCAYSGDSQLPFMKSNFTGSLAQEIYNRSGKIPKGLNNILAKEQVSQIIFLGDAARMLDEHTDEVYLEYALPDAIKKMIGAGVHEKIAHKNTMVQHDNASSKFNALLESYPGMAKDFYDAFERLYPEPGVFIDTILNMRHDRLAVHRSYCRLDRDV